MWRGNYGEGREEQIICPACKEVVNGPCIGEPLGHIHCFLAHEISTFGKVMYAGKQVYEGVGAQLVTKDNDILSPRQSQKILNHSPEGFNWGFNGSGAAQLALAILYDVTGDDIFSASYHQQFKFDIVAGWGESWRLTVAGVLSWIRDVAINDIDWGYYDWTGGLKWSTGTGGTVATHYRR